MAVASAPGYGGYDHKFAGKVPERFMCNICTKVLREPHLTVCCGQHFCESCLENWFKRQQKKSCPHCREENCSHFLNKERKRDIFELKIHCTHHGHGCQWIGELGDLQTHLDSKSGCGCVEVECTNKCKLNGKTLKFQRKALQDHLDNECTRRRYKCEYCGHEDTYRSITGNGYRQTYDSHYDECDMYPLDCPNWCGKKQIKRTDMSTHRDKCPEELLECPFKAEGCKTRVVRRDFDNHMSTQMLQHMLLLRKECRLLKAESDSLKKAISENVAILLKTSTMDQKGPLQSIQTLLDEPHLIQLKEEGDTLTIEIPDLSHYEKRGEVWHSQPFYFREGYKMRLALHKSAKLLISLSLILMKGEFDDELEWPIRCHFENFYELQYHVLEIKVRSKQQIAYYDSPVFEVTGLDRVHDDQVVRSGSIFLTHGTRDEQEMVAMVLAEVRIMRRELDDMPDYDDD